MSDTNINVVAILANDGELLTKAVAEIEKLRAENERLTNNARSDARLLAAYHKWCDMHGCAPSSSDLSKARAALGGSPSHDKDTD
jgi:hypothetical protein